MIESIMETIESVGSVPRTRRGGPGTDNVSKNVEEGLYVLLVGM